MRMEPLPNVGVRTAPQLTGGQPGTTGQAKRSFFDKTVSSLDRAIAPEFQRLKDDFKRAIGRDTSSVVTKTLESAVKKARAELAHIDDLYTPQGFPKTPGKILPGKPNAAEIKEMRSRLTAVANTDGYKKGAPLNGLSVEKTLQMRNLILQNRHDPMFKLMGASKFLGYALKSEENVAKAGPIIRTIAAQMTTCERVALYGYTCADYSMLNSALRNDKTDPKINAYILHATRAIHQCPYYTDKNGVTKRAINDPEGQDGWAPNRYQNNVTVTEKAFTSTAVDPTAATYTMIVTGRGHDVSAFSAWPGETEVLYPPGTEFQITVAPGAPNVFHAKQVVT